LSKKGAVTSRDETVRKSLNPRSEARICVSEIDASFGSRTVLRGV
jgi:hypothetical protein